VDDGERRTGSDDVLGAADRPIRGGREVGRDQRRAKRGAHRVAADDEHVAGRAAHDRVRDAAEQEP